MLRLLASLMLPAVPCTAIRCRPCSNSLDQASICSVVRKQLLPTPGMHACLGVLVAGVLGESTSHIASGGFCTSPLCPDT